MENSPLGIIMGKGALPALLVDFCKKKKRPYFLFPIHSQADESFVKKHPHVWIRFGQIKNTLHFLKEKNIKEIVFVGHVNRPSFCSLKLDWKGIQWVFSIGWKVFGDDGLLSGIVNLVEKEGFKVIGVHQLITEILMPKGSLGKINPSEEDKKNIHIGFEAAKKLGQQDIGQGVIVEEGIVLASETKEGTDSLIKHTSHLFRNPGSAILVKVAKPFQEMRVDLPTVGPKTIENLAQYGYKGLALEAGAGLILHQEKVIELANKKGIFVYGVTGKNH